MFDNLVKALGWSALLHLLVIAALWYTQQPVPAMPIAQPRAIEAFVYQPIRPKPPADNLEAVALAEPVMPDTTSAPKPAPRPTRKSVRSAVKAEPEVVPEKQVSAPRTVDNPVDYPANKVIANHSPTTEATHVTNPTQEPHAAMSLAERSLYIAARRNNDISSAALQASQLRPELRDRPATTSKAQLKPEHAADNVLMVLSDGSFIEKVADYCYHANQGANLRADISSMKPVPCGKDKNAAMYERIMSKVGQDRR
jgi:type IV secretory pathway VirB10-like protein